MPKAMRERAQSSRNLRLERAEREPQAGRNFSWNLLQVCSSTLPKALFSEAPAPATAVRSRGVFQETAAPENVLDHLALMLSRPVRTSQLSIVWHRRAATLRSSTTNYWRTHSFSLTKVIRAFSGRITSIGIWPSRTIKAVSMRLSQSTNKTPQARRKCYSLITTSTLCNAPAPASKAG